MSGEHGETGEGTAAAATRSPDVARTTSRSRVVWVVGKWLTITLALLLASAAVLTVAGPRVLPFQTFYVRSGSMQPTLPIGSLAFYTPVQAAELHPGDIIVFSRPGTRDHGELVTHRIVRVESGASGRVFVTKGDANGQVDDWRVPATGEGWRYRFAIPHAGYVVGMLGSSLGRVWLGTLGVVAAAVLLLVELWRPRRPAVSVP